MGDGHVEKGYVNHDECDACGGSGDLEMCDRCPASFHFACLAPPQPKESLASLDEWLCNRCRFASGGIKTPQGVGGPLAKTIAYLARSNPKEFVPPAYIKKHALARSREPATEESSSSSNGVSVIEHMCTECGQEGTTATLIRCSAPGCGHQPHLYCADPPLLIKPPFWQCERHTSSTVQHNLISTEKFPLDFFPPTKGGRLSTLSAGKLAETASRDYTGGASDGTRTPPVYEQIAQLQKQQQELLAHAIPAGVPPDVQMADASASVTALSQLTPVFTQFLAWQRLMQLQGQVAAVQNEAGVPAVGVPSYHDSVVGAVPTGHLLDHTTADLKRSGEALQSSSATKRMRASDETMAESTGSVDMASAAALVRTQTPVMGSAVQEAKSLPLNLADKPERRDYAREVLAVLSQDYASEPVLADFRDEHGNVFIAFHRTKVSLGRRMAENETDPNLQHVDLRVLSQDTRFLSRQHGNIYRDEELRWYFVIEGRNGQKINDKLHKCNATVELVEGDEVKFGDLYLRFHIAGESSGNVAVPLA